MGNISYDTFDDGDGVEFDSAKLSEILNMPFTIKGVTKEVLGGFDGIVITTTEELAAGDKKTDQFYTTSEVIVKKLTKDDLLASLEKGDTVGPVKCVSVKSQKTGRNYLDIKSV